MGELQRHVRPQPLAPDPLEHADVGLDDGPRLGLVAHVLAEEGGVREQALLVQPPQHGHGLVEGLAGDEAGRPEAHPVAADEAADRRRLRGREDRATRERR